MKAKKLAQELWDLDKKVSVGGVEVSAPELARQHKVTQGQEDEDKVITYDDVRAFLKKNGIRHRISIHDYNKLLRSFAKDDQELFRKLRSSGAEVSFPKIENASHSERAEDLKYPRGKEDWRGKELLAALKTQKDPSLFNVIFVGYGHIPLFYNALTKDGFRPLITSYVHSAKLSPYESRDLINMLRAYPMHPAKQGMPLLLVGDCHYSEYKMALPNPGDLKSAGIKKVVFHLELKAAELSSLDIEKGIQKTPLWGHQNLHRYAQQLKEAGIAIEFCGLETNPGYYN